MDDTAGRQRGQAVVLLLAIVTLAALAVLAVAEFSGRVASRSRAQTAADAAALAATTGGRTAAERLAAANGGRVVGYVANGDEVLVIAEVDGEVARARATSGP
jgi:Flp pilus assembly protein TadG